MTDKQNPLDNSLGSTLAEQRQQIEKMDALALMAGKMAHDFNNVLMIIGGSLEILEDRMPPDPKIAHFLATAVQGVDRGALLAHQLLAFARPQYANVDVLQVDNLLLAVSDQLRNELGTRYTVEFSAGAHGALCRTAAEQFRSAVTKLTDNAHDAMPDGGVLTLETSIACVDSETANLYRAVPGNYVRVAVSDTGDGIAPDQLSKAFEPFFSGRPNQGKTGFGLSLAYSFAKHSGGFISIESTPGKGTTVTVYLPTLTTE